MSRTYRLIGKDSWEWKWHCSDYYLIDGRWQRLLYEGQELAKAKALFHSDNEVDERNADAYYRKLKNRRAKRKNARLMNKINKNPQFADNVIFDVSIAMNYGWF